MLDENRLCIDIVQQIVAVRAALAKLGVEILKDEAKECSIKNNNQDLEKTIDQLFKIS